jgi:serine/threonine-protein kinase RsbW
MPGERAAPLILAIPSDPSLLPLIRRFVEASCLYAGLPAEVIEAVVLATHEAMQNILRHAHSGRPEAIVEIHCLPTPDGIEVSLFDEGEPFDLTAVPHLRPNELRMGGRGVFLMRTLMDELSSQPRPNRGNQLRMVKRRECGERSA